MSYKHSKLLTVLLAFGILLTLTAKFVFGASWYGDIMPNTNNTYVLGNETFMWKNISAVDIYCRNCLGGVEIDESSLVGLPTYNATYDAYRDTNATTECADNEILDGSGTCLSLLTNWNITYNVTYDAYSDTNASTACSGDEILIGGGVCLSLLTDWNYTYNATYDAITDTDTNASTGCSANEFLSGGGTNECFGFISGWNRTDQGNTSAEILAIAVERADWTTIDNYPSACTGTNFVQGLGDTLTCAVPTDTISVETLQNITGTWDLNQAWSNKLHGGNITADSLTGAQIDENTFSDMQINGTSAFPLTINSTNINNRLKIIAGADAGGVSFYNTTGDYLGFIGTNQTSWLKFYGHTGVGMRFTVSGASSPTMYITTGEKVGIGTSSPTTKLEVIGYVNATSGFCISPDCITGWSDVNVSWSNSTYNATYDVYDMGNTSAQMVTAINVSDAYYQIKAKDLVCTNCLTGTEIAELTDADISDTLTCSDLVAGSEVVSDSEVSDDITIDSSKWVNTTTGVNSTVIYSEVMCLNPTCTANTTWNGTHRIDYGG